MGSNRTDEILMIQRAQQGDALAFARLHDRYYPVIYRYYYYRAHPEQSPVELTSDLFIRMVDRIGFYKPESDHFLDWLFSLARSILREDLFSRGLRFSRAEEGPALQTRQPAEPLSSKEVSTAEGLRQALALLTPEERDVLIGKCVERRSSRAVGREIGRSAAAVRMLQYQGLHKLGVSTLKGPEE